MTEQLFHRALKASLVCCLAVILTGCEELFNILDNPIQTSISMATTDVKLTVGDTYQRQPTCVSPATIVYASSDATVATVDANGVVTGVAAGEATITASVAAVDYWTAASVSYKVIVKPAFVAATDIALDQTMKVIKLGGGALAITATTVPSDANYTWESDAAAIATVDETGKVTPVGVGIAMITAKSGDVKATCKIFVGNEVDLSAKTADYTVNNYDILKNELNNAYALTIPDGYKVAFAGLTTTMTVTCSGDATIILADGSTNTVNVSTAYKAGIKVGPTDKTLTIEAETAGTGKLTVKGGSMAAGIGTDDSQTGGNITINGGTVNAKGGTNAAGIGTGDTEYNNNACGDITINGGTVTATGGVNAAGIGTGAAEDKQSKCGAITISANVTSVTATKGWFAPNSIGVGRKDANFGGTQTCGTITIGGDATTYAAGVTTSPFTYPTAP